MVRHCSSISIAARQQLVRRGFTIIELMIVVLIVGVLLALAYPSFLEQVRKSRRADAITALTAVQQAQERWRGNRPSYAGFSTATPANGLVVPSTTSAGYYTISIDPLTLSATSYDLLAEAVSGKSQEHDGNCKQMGIRARAGLLRYGSGDTSIAWGNPEPDAGRCWAR